jgi:peptidyl-prolyl cis-trans isomerase D
MSNPELSAIKTNDAYSKKAKNRPVPKFMSMTWLRVHMKKIIIAVIATFVISLFFIGYGTHVENNERERRESTFKSDTIEKANSKFALSEKLKDKANFPALLVSYNNNNASFTSAIDVKTINRVLKSTDEYSKLSKMPEGIRKFYSTSLKESVIDNLIKINLIDLYAKTNNVVSADQLNASIESDMRQALQNKQSDFEMNLITNGLTLEEYKQEKIKEKAMMAVYSRNITQVNPASATEDYLKTYYESHKNYFKKDNEISFDYLQISPSALIDSIKISDEQINSYYEANKSTFLSSPRAEVYHIFINTSNPDYLKSMIVSESDLQNTYNQNKSRFTEPEQVKASHILIKPRGEGDDEKRFEEAKNVIQALYEKAKNGEDFAKLATENSEDTGSAANGGELGYFGRNQMVKPFEDAAFSTEVGAITEPVRTSYGYHIIKVEDKKAEKVKSFDEVKNLLVQEARESEADRTAESKLEELSRRLYASSLIKFQAEVSKVSNGSSVSSKGKLPLFFKGEITDDYTPEAQKILREEICDGYNYIVPEIEEQIFKLKPGEMTEVIKTQNGYHLFRLEKFENPVELKLTESLKAKITGILSNKAADEEAASLTQKLVQEHSSDSIEDLVKAYGKEEGEKKHSFKGIEFSESPGSNANLYEGMGLFSDNGRIYLPEFHKALLSAIKENKMNTYLPPFKTQFGWNIVKVTDYKKDQYDSFENCRDTIRRIITFEPSDDEINKYYDENKSMFDTPATRTIRQIICNQETAEKVYEELTKGAGFSMLARKYSSDSSAAFGGLMSPTTKGQYTASLDNEIWKLKVGEYTKPIETPYGWVVAQLESETPEVKNTLDNNIKTRIKASFSNSYKQEAWSYFIKGLMNQAYIVRNQELIDMIE